MVWMEERSRLGKAAQKHYNVNYTVYLRMFLKVGAAPHLCTAFQPMGQAEEVFFLPKHHVLQLNV